MIVVSRNVGRWLWVVLGSFAFFALAACGSNIAPASEASATPIPPPTPTAAPAAAAAQAPTPDAHAINPAMPPADAADATASDDGPVFETRTLTPLWSFATGGNVNDSPRVDKQHVYLAAEGAGIFALDPDNGDEQWHYAPDAGIWGRSLALAGDALLVGVSGQELVSLDTGTGQERWRIALVGEVQRPPLVVGDTLYVGTTFVGTDMDNDPEAQAWVYALDVASGEEVWAFETGNYLMVTPALDDGILYAGGSYYDPSRDVEEGGPMRIYALDAASGSEQWAVEHDSGLIKRLYASDGLLHYLAYQDRLFTLDTSTGEEVWSYHTENWTPDFLLADGVIYFGVGNGFMHAVDARSGEQLWKTRLGIFRRPLEAPTLVDGVLYLHVAQQQIFALDRESGEVLWVAEHAFASREGLVIAGGLMYLVGTDGVLSVMAAP
jgi:eukaryotic-like serine/threonine-protein kinase